MSVLATTHPTLLDVANRLDPKGKVDNIVEILAQTNEVLDDMVFLEGNLPTGNKSTTRSGLPAPTWRKLYGFVQPTKSRTLQVTDNCGMMEAYAEVDKALADLNSNTAAFRLSEDAAHIEGMSQEAASSLFYANETTAPEEFTGFAPRFNSLSAENADNIINAAGTSGDSTSIWLVGWGPRSAFGIYPRGSKAGIQMTDKGQVTKESSSGLMEVYRSHYRWDMGLAMPDWRYVVRIANIDITDLGTIANTKSLITWMTMATERIPNMGSVRPVFYMNRFLREKLRLGILEKTSSNLTWDNVAGKRVVMFDGIPVKRVDALLKTETAVA